MQASSGAAGGRAIPEPDEPRMPPAHDSPSGSAGGLAEVTLRVAQDRDRIAEAMNDIVIHRVFSAGLTLETALGLLDSRRGAAAKIQDARGELDLAIRDIRNVLFDHYQLDPRPPGRQP
jgi:Histidine kinase